MKLEVDGCDNTHTPLASGRKAVSIFFMNDAVVPRIKIKLFPWVKCKPIVFLKPGEEGRVPGHCILNQACRPVLRKRKRAGRQEGPGTSAAPTDGAPKVNIGPRPLPTDPQDPAVAVAAPRGLSCGTSRRRRAHFQRRRSTGRDVTMPRRI